MGKTNPYKKDRTEYPLVADYKKAFGESPPRINGVAIMTDSDDTNGSATAYYGDIIFRKE